MENIERAHLRADGSDLATIGEAFANGLMQDLPRCLEPKKWFITLPRAALAIRTTWKYMPDVRTGGPVAAELVPYGIRPLMVFLASGAAMTLCDNLVRHGTTPHLLPIVIHCPGQVAELPPEESLRTKPTLQRIHSISTAMIALEIRRAVACSEETAKTLFRWLVGVAHVKPFVFGGFEASHQRDGLVLRPAGTQNDLLSQWSRTAKEPFFPCGQYEEAP
jgi:hypothetical protein